MALSLFRRAEIAPPPDIEAASLRSDRFRLERERDWRRLEAIVEALEKNRLRRISDDDLLALPVLYRQAASSLAVARETSLDAAALTYLESLVRRPSLRLLRRQVGRSAEDHADARHHGGRGDGGRRRRVHARR